MVRSIGILAVACVGLGCQTDLAFEMLRDGAFVASTSAGVEADFASEPLQRFSYERDLLGVRASVLLWAPDEALAFAAADTAFDQALGLQRLASVWEADSELSRLNSSLATAGSHAVSADLASVLLRVEELTSRTHGAFDVSVGALLEAQGYYASEGEPRSPSRDALVELRRVVGSDAWRVEPAPGMAVPPVLHAQAGLVLPTWRIVGARVVSDAPNVRLDLGALLKGLAADRMASALQRQGIEHALINLGASTVLALEAPPGELGWHYRIQLGSEWQEWTLENEAVSVSEQLGQPVFLDGRIASHLVDPRTLKPVDHGVLKAVVRHRSAASAASADAYSTAVLVMGLAEAQRHLSTRGNRWIWSAWVEVVGAPDEARRAFTVGQSTDYF